MHLASKLHVSFFICIADLHRARCVSLEVSNAFNRVHYTMCGSAINSSVDIIVLQVLGYPNMYIKVLCLPHPKAPCERSTEMASVHSPNAHLHFADVL